MAKFNFKHSWLAGTLIMLLATRALPVAAQEGDRLFSVAEAELKREMTGFSKANMPPYYLAYRITETNSAVITSSFGSLVGVNHDHSRVLAIDTKVGDYEFDSSHPMDRYEDADLSSMGGGIHSIELPLEDRREPIQFILWQQTQNSYRNALSQFKALRNTQRTNTGPSVADFSKESPAIHIDPRLPDFSGFYNEQQWIARIKKYSAPFLANPDLVDADASIEISTERKYFLSSEGARVVQNRTFAYVTLRGSIRAEDGDVVPLHKTYFAFEPSQLPSDETVLADVARMISKLNILKTAPVAEPYTGPAILQAHAAGVFFHEIFGHRVEGHRLKDINDGQTFKGKVKEQVLPKTLSVVFDPTRSSFNGQALNGYYQYDDQAVKAQKVKVVEDGVLKTFLMSRSPIENFPNSNGHGRAQAGSAVVSRQSNLIIENKKVVPMNDLRKMLINECQKQKRPYGYLFMDVIGGFTTTNRVMPNAFNIFPTEVYRVYADGRADELVRGVDLIGTPLAMFAEIQAADDKNEVFTGFCGAESGSIPVTAVSPSLFVKRIETQKKATMQLDKAVMPRPSDK